MLIQKLRDQALIDVQHQFNMTEQRLREVKRGRGMLKRIQREKGVTEPSLLNIVVVVDVVAVVDIMQASSRCCLLT